MRRPTKMKLVELQICFINIFFPVINPDNSFEVLIDNKVVNSGSLLEDVRYALLRMGGGGGGVLKKKRFFSRT